MPTRSHQLSVPYAQEMAAKQRQELAQHQAAHFEMMTKSMRAGVEVEGDKGLWMFVSLIPLNKMESVHFRNGMLNKISNGIHPNYLDLGMMSNKEVSLTYLPFVRLDEQVRLGRGTMSRADEAEGRCEAIPASLQNRDQRR
ncbi:hypothetical protein BLNAU_1205 [Blattamonas nauphoetae]|uniref:Uncharacterized protein n=1 Tax=Blattamonas nauphoetae TaxID=2049346 RepID=A0ABQ9YIQ7_9EUKA|nr:hypothetical protein BLNAU_1205 [Blattamonas nauphoetae]